MPFARNSNALSWTSGLLPILKNGIYFGEIYDARQEGLPAISDSEVLPFDNLLVTGPNVPRDRFKELMEFGVAATRIFLQEYEPHLRYERVIAVPFHAPTGLLRIKAPDEPWKVEPDVVLNKGSYRLVAAQVTKGEMQERVDLFFEQLDSPLATSRILVADLELEPPPTLLETADPVELL
jgi:hypothetical protein